MKPDAILVNCAPTKFDKPELPLSIEPLATYLDSKGYKVQIIDNRIDDFRRMKLNNALYVGISTWSGRQILNGIETAEFVREKDPEIPIIWGGVHPSIMPDQTIKDRRVDIVARGEGEHTLLELTKALEKGKSIKKIKGLTYKDKKGRIHKTEDRPFMNLDELPFINFKLFDLSKYNVKEVFGYHTSRGCPHQCTFCVNQTFHKSCWRAKSAEKVVEELEIIKEKFNPKMVGIADDNFYASKKRIEEICKGILERKIDIKWEADCRIDYFITYEKEFIDLFLKAGCTDLWLGGESGSVKTQEMIRKGYGVDAILKFANKTKDLDFTPHICFVVGFPHEEHADVKQTVNLIDSILTINPRLRVNNIWLYTPFPGTPLYQEVIKFGYTPPDSLEAWGNFLFDSEWVKTKWLDKKTKDLANALTLFSLFSFDTPHVEHNWRKGWKKWAYIAMSKSARLRWKYKIFKWPFELEFAKRYQARRGMV